MYSESGFLRITVFCAIILPRSGNRLYLQSRFLHGDGIGILLPGFEVGIGAACGGLEVITGSTICAESYFDKLLALHLLRDNEGGVGGGRLRWLFPFSG